MTEILNPDIGAPAPDGLSPGFQNLLSKTVTTYASDVSTALSKSGMVPWFNPGMVNSRSDKTEIAKVFSRSDLESKFASAISSSYATAAATIGGAIAGAVASPLGLPMTVGSYIAVKEQANILAGWQRDFMLRKDKRLGVFCNEMSRLFGHAADLGVFGNAVATVSAKNSAAKPPSKNC